MYRLKVNPQANRVFAVLVIVSLLLAPATPVQAATSSSLPEAFTRLYVIYNHPETKTFSIELRNQTQNLDGSVTAQIAVRAESLIAYNLTFDEGDANGGYWKDINFLPLYPGHVYEIATITIKPGGYFTVQGTKFGLDESILWKMTLIQMCILAMHLVGAKPPVDYYELAESIPEAFDTLYGPVYGGAGAVASLTSAVFEIFGREPQPAQAVIDLGDAISEVDAGADAIADGINLITKSKGVKATGSLVQRIFGVLNKLEIASDLKRTYDAYKQLQDYPDLATATITLAPEVVGQPDRYRVFEINQTFNSEFVFKNRGSEVWLPEQGYELWIMLEIFPLNRTPLAATIPRNKDARWGVQQQAPAIPGIYHLKYQMALKGVPIGLPIPAEIVVVPEKSDDLQDLIRALVDETMREAGERFDEFRAELERQIAEAIISEILRRLREICGGTGVTIVIGGLSIWSRWRRFSKKRSSNV